jgi:hypothetical protein
MKKLMQIDENKLIEIIKSMLAEQTVTPVRSNINYTPSSISTFDIPTQKVQGSIGMGDDNIEYLAQQQAAQQQQASKQQQKSRVCPSGYKEKTIGPYKLCDSGKAIKTLQTKLGFKGSAIDGKLGVLTMNAAKNQKLTETNGTILDSKINNFNSNVVTTNTNQNNLGVVIDVRGLGISTLNKAFVKNNDGNEIILMTTSLGAVVYSTTCKLLTQNKIWAITRKQFIEAQSVPKLTQRLYYNFCSKTATNINVTKLIKGYASVLPKNEQSLIQGNTFRATIKQNEFKSIHIISDSNAVVLYTDCNNLKTNNTFYRNYGQTYKGKPIKLDSLGDLIKPSFCATK